jgi:organic hydroperoxide reductase OsmC/OhrA
MPKTHHYELTVTWTGNSGTGTSGYQAFERAHDVSIEGKPTIPGSADPAFRGDRERWIVVTDYVDHPTGTLSETPDGGGHFDEVSLHPQVTITTAEKMDRAIALHERAHDLCYISNSVNFAVLTDPTVVGAVEGG